MNELKLIEGGETPRSLVEYDGFMVDEETGEIVSVIVPKDSFRVDSVENFDWVMKKLGEEEAKKLAVDESWEVKHARAVLENAEIVKSDYQRRIESLLFRFRAELEEFARSEIAKMRKGKTFKTLMGSIAFRATPAKLEFVDEPSVVAWMREHCSAALRVSVDLNAVEDELERRAIIELSDSAGSAAKLAPMKSWIPDDVKCELIEKPVAGFDVIAAGESVTIKTGVE